MTPTPLIDEYIAAVQKVMGEHRGYAVYDLVDAHGVRYMPTPWSQWEHTYDEGRIKECYENALLLAVAHPELTYVEGLAVAGFFPVHHAWCVTDDGFVVDPTWAPTGNIGPVEDDWEYRGVPLRLSFVADTVLGKGTSGVLDAIEIIRDGLPAEAIEPPTVLG